MQMRNFFLFCVFFLFLGSAAFGATETYSNGDKYVGDIKNGMRHGVGTYYWISHGETYKGKWKKDQPHGKGFQTFKDGTTYEGNWKNGERNGYGILTTSQGKRFQIKYKKGKEISRTELSPLPSDPWNIGRVEFDYYYTPYDL